MSTFIESETFLRRQQASTSEDGSSVAFRPLRADFGIGPDSGISFVPASKRAVRSNVERKPLVKRRMKGWLREISGRTAIVVLVDGADSFDYEMPSERLVKSGISVANQPFQMDEVEMPMEDSFIVGYQFKPLAKETDAFVDTMKMDHEQKVKFDLILKKFAKSKA
jgi:hypothetical protein